MMVGTNLKDVQLQQIVDKTILIADTDGDGKISFEEFSAVRLIFGLIYRVRYFRGRVSSFNKSKSRKHCFLASDWLKLETLPENTVLYCRR